jgi:D-alanyl-lipoteichoic acid acyltransferase DltB (MBOAT superfamily)
MLLYTLSIRLDRSYGRYVLLAASVTFYSYWNVRFLPILLCSVLLNYGCGLVICRNRERDRVAGLAMAAGIAADLAALAYFKYANFLLSCAEPLTGTSLALDVVLPLGISFFTFTQIAFLVDCRRGYATEPSLVNYALFVTYFPHLIAGPILHHAEMMPQFNRPDPRIESVDLAMGATAFVVGLAKKVLAADGVSSLVGPVFDAPLGTSFAALDAWTAALAYTMQIYYDFSGYSDMAVGLSILFGVRLPVNFMSPYQATSIIEFWRRWHMTLSRFLRDYLYFPLGGNRRGRRRRYANLMAVMLLGGLWHGAGWTFVVWGGLHGLYLGINHAWHAVKVPLWRPVAWAVTFLAVVVAWVFFRASSMAAAGGILAAMAGLHGLGGGTGATVADPKAFATIAALLAGAVLLPNLYRVIGSDRLALGLDPLTASWLRWRPAAPVAAALAVLALVSVVYMSRTSEFLYFQF